MSARFLLALLVTVSLAAVVGADTVIVDENFDSYADTTEMEAVWGPDNGNGNSPISGPVGILIPDLGAGLVPPNDDPPNIEGNAVNILSDINEFIGGGGLPAGVVPTASQSVRVSGDFFDDAVGNKRNSIGLRNKTNPSNLIELGFYNANTFDPEAGDPNDPPVLDQEATGYAYRIALFGEIGGDLVRVPSWQYFPLDPALDFNDSGLVNGADIGAAWHRYTAEISLTEVTVTFDLFRDGVTNDPNDFAPGIGMPGVDSSVTWQIAPSGSPDEFDSLRFGAPSGITSANETVVDNILLELIDIGGVNADFNGDNSVDGLDFLAWQQNSGQMGGAGLADGDANGDGNVDGIDLGIWGDQYGTTNPLAAAATAVPEPTSVGLSLLACMGFALAGRRR